MNAVTAIEDTLKLRCVIFLIADDAEKVWELIEGLKAWKKF
jgi:hypothetical protein